jgi:hypothetical protein
MISVILFSAYGCTKNTEESQVKEQLINLASELSFKKNLVPLRQILKTKSLIEGFFHRDVQIKLKIRETTFNIPNAQILSQNLFLLNKMVGKLDLDFQNIQVQKGSDSNGTYYQADFEIDAIGTDAQENKKIDEEIKFQFYFRKFKDSFLIYRGQNPDSE